MRVQERKKRNREKKREKERTGENKGEEERKKRERRKTTEIERKREKTRENERKREEKRGKDVQCQLLSSCIQFSKKINLIYWQKCSKVQKVACCIYGRELSL